MSDMLNKVKDAVVNHENKKSTPGDGVENKADGFADNKVNDLANNAGVPQGDDGILDKVTNIKVNNDIPGGN
ncbi:hypothetical protein ANO11243_071090 [Dothideomycetidae sp. 11243]|nr:hypothetical protein ANO11243_071090 [fungal sp. No.11243]